MKKTFSKRIKYVSAIALFAITGVVQASTLPTNISGWTGSPFVVGDKTFTLLSTNITDSTSLGVNAASPGEFGFTINTSFMSAATLEFNVTIDAGSSSFFDEAFILATSPCLGLGTSCFSATLTSTDLASPLSFDTTAGSPTVSDFGAITPNLKTATFTYTTTNPGFKSNATEITFTQTVVPVPAAVWLFGTGLLGLVGVARRKAHT
ncbi:MAG: VPLPA-CTERM sorting domain-containing protein [Gammaproteobacteria bacterium]|nr:VPLPA-CTERM sorting domain-containing protein [Gammaproteobacteria bacterium]